MVRGTATPCDDRHVAEPPHPCQGGEQFAGEQDDDPDNATDCASAYSGSSVIATTEFQVMRR